MQMSLQGKPQPGDQEHAQRIVAAACGVVARYSDVNTALRDGYRPFHPTGKLGEEVHYMIACAKGISAPIRNPVHGMMRYR
jgi:hypothetical protein